VQDVQSTCDGVLTTTATDVRAPVAVLACIQMFRLCDQNLMGMACNLTYHFAVGFHVLGLVELPK
jgi:hypothetical protein